MQHKIHVVLKRSVLDTGVYWLGATEAPESNTLWFWVDGTQMTNETGWSYWDKNEPSTNAGTTCLVIRTINERVVFRDRVCTKSLSFLCEMAPP